MLYVGNWFFRQFYYFEIMKSIFISVIFFLDRERMVERDKKCFFFPLWTWTFFGLNVLNLFGIIKMGVVLYLPSFHHPIKIDILLTIYYLLFFLIYSNINNNYCFEKVNKVIIKLKILEKCKFFLFLFVQIT